jgi:hypothetical protein
MSIEVSLIILLFICLVFLILLGLTGSFSDSALVISTTSSILFIFMQMSNLIKMPFSTFKLPFIDGTQLGEMKTEVPKIDEVEDVNKTFQVRIGEQENSEGIDTDQMYELNEYKPPRTSDDLMINNMINNKRRGGFNKAFMDTIDLRRDSY